jgi:hypothetical protein
MMHPMKTAPSVLAYSDAVPTVPGWYWRRDASSETVLRFAGLPWQQPPRHWREARAEAIATARTLPDVTPAQIAELEARPDASWLIQWAGPLTPPVNCKP